MNLLELAQKYETEAFLDGDPSWFMHQVKGNENQELMAFIAQSISYGSRKQFLPKLHTLLEHSEGNVKDWLVSRRFLEIVPRSNDCFYRLYTCEMMADFLESLTVMVEQYGSMKEYVRKNSSDTLSAIEALCNWFNKEQPSVVIPRNTKSACKRICMFMRWMVRDNSPVDLGLWSDIIDRRTLIMPLDTHVLQEAQSLGLIHSRTASMSSAIRLTERLKEYFPDDPLLGDYALFGYGVNK